MGSNDRGEKRPEERSQEREWLWYRDARVDREWRHAERQHAYGIVVLVMLLAVIPVVILRCVT